MRTHWICQLFGHRYKSVARRQSGLSWTYMLACRICGDIRDPDVD